MFSAKAENGKAHEMVMKRIDMLRPLYPPPPQKHVPITQPELKIILVEMVWKNIKQGPVGTKTTPPPSVLWQSKPKFEEVESSSIFKHFAHQ
jgi:hypothetical protein